MVVEFKEKTKTKLEEIKEKVERKKEDVKEFVDENPDGALLIATAGIGSISYFGKKMFKILDERKQMRLLECRFYDRRTDTYWFSKRPLRTSEKLEMERLYGQGYGKGEILKVMGLLK